MEFRGGGGKLTLPPSIFWFSSLYFLNALKVRLWTADFSSIEYQSNSIVSVRVIKPNFYTVGYHLIPKLSALIFHWCNLTISSHLLLVDFLISTNERRSKCLLQNTGHVLKIKAKEEHILQAVLSKNLDFHV